MYQYKVLNVTNGIGMVKFEWEGQFQCRGGYKQH